MSWTFVLRHHELESFLRCRRAWDLGSRERRNYVPVDPPVFDFDKAVHDALAVYYFPAMDDWNRAIVRPLAMAGFRRAMDQDRKVYEQARGGLTAGDRERFEHHLDLGERILDGYFTWAMAVDEFESIFSDEEVWAPIPDPHDPSLGIVNADGRTIRFLGRVDQLISDADDEYWVVDHRLVTDWTGTERLLLDMAGVAHLWAMELSYPHLQVAGTVYNELRTTAGDYRSVVSGPVEDKRDMRAGRPALRKSFASPGSPLPRDPAAPPDEPPEPAPPAVDETRVERQVGNDCFRRTWIRRSRAAVRDVEVRVGLHTLEMRDPDIAVYPNPVADNCGGCLYRPPCLALNTGGDVDAVLAAGFRHRTEEEFEEERLRWSKTRRGTRASLGSRVGQEDGG